MKNIFVFIFLIFSLSFNALGEEVVLHFKVYKKEGGMYIGHVKIVEIKDMKLSRAISLLESKINKLPEEMFLRKNSTKSSEFIFTYYHSSKNNADSIYSTFPSERGSIGIGVRKAKYFEKILNTSPSQDEGD